MISYTIAEVPKCIWKLVDSSWWAQSAEGLQALRRCREGTAAGHWEGRNTQLQQEPRSEAAAWSRSQARRKATFWAAAVGGQVISRAPFSPLQIKTKLKANFIKCCMFVFSFLPLFIKRDSKCLPLSKQNVRLAHMLNTCVINHGNATSVWEVSDCTRHSLQKRQIMVPWHSQLLF